ncbi:hypothetical protein HZS_5220 [Henneguya salminicola]|nr:hypothetical protein HZS_5220 [Henneguya salminicola]
MPNLLIVAVYSVLTLVGEIGQCIWLPLWLDSTRIDTENRNDPGTLAITFIISITNVLAYLLLYKLFSRKKLNFSKDIVIASIINTLSSFFIPYVSNSSRNSLTAQALLLNVSVPLTALIRFFWFKKLPTLKKAICIIIIIFGFILSIIPDILKDSNIPIESKDDVTSNWRVRMLWALAFVIFSVILPVFVNIYAEWMFKKKNIYDFEMISLSSLNLVNPTLEINDHDIYSFCLILSLLNLSSQCLFWVDIIPGVGYSTNLSEMCQK